MTLRIGGFEELVLLSVAGLGDDAYGVTVQRRLEEEMGSAASIGAVYTALDRLEKKGFLKSRHGAATPERGGRRKRMFALTAQGSKVLREMRTVRRRLWTAAPQTA